MVGALIAVGEGKMSQRDIYEMLTIPSHNSWNHNVCPAPASGLYLVNVEYPEEIYSNQLKNDDDDNDADDTDDSKIIKAIN